MEDANESYLHEELLSLLDAGLRGDSSAVSIEGGEGIYGGEYDYMINRDSRRREEAKAKERKPESQPTQELFQENFKFSDELIYWHDTQGNDFPDGVSKFIQIGVTYSGLYALGDNGQLYVWNWEDKQPLNVPHPINAKLLNSGIKNVLKIFFV